MKKKTIQKEPSNIFLITSRDLRYQLKSIITKLHLCEQSSKQELTTDLLSQYSSLDSDFQILSEMFTKSKEVIQKVFTNSIIETNSTASIIPQQEEQFMIDTKTVVSENVASQGDITFEAYTGPASDSDQSDSDKEDTMKSKLAISMQLAKIFMGTADNEDASPKTVSFKQSKKKKNALSRQERIEKRRRQEQEKLKQQEKDLQSERIIRELKSVLGVRQTSPST